MKKASGYSLTGFVTNTSNGKVSVLRCRAKLKENCHRGPDSEQVEGEAQGDEGSIKKFLKDINDGPPAAHVVKLEKSELGVHQGETTFGVK